MPPHSLQPPLSIDERRTLLSLARRAVLAGLAGAAPPETESPAAARRRPGGVFVTLRVGGELRGCIGVVAPDESLAEAVVHCAAAAAREDPRFSPLDQDDVGRLAIEISILSDPRPLEAPERLELGRHGLIVSQGKSQGLLLPQVPLEHGWDREAYLEQTCRKAGLAADAWRHGARVRVFEAEVFAEPPPNAAPPSSRSTTPRRSR